MRRMAFFMLYRNCTKRLWICRHVFSPSVGFNSGPGSVRTFSWLVELISNIVIGWFPFLFYSTTWVGETYFRYENPESAASSSDTLGDVGRLGSLSLVIFSGVTFLSSVLLPHPAPRLEWRHYCVDSKESDPVYRLHGFFPISSLRGQ